MQLVIHGVFSEVLFWKIPLFDYALSHLDMDEKSVKLAEDNKILSFVSAT